MAGIKREKMTVTVLEPRPVRGKPLVVMSISGGKDSLAMWLKLWEKKTDNLVPVHFVFGWEWPVALYEIKRVEKITGIKCYIVRVPGLYSRMLKTKGWSTWAARWCAGHKRDNYLKFISSLKRGQPGFEIRKALGVAADEKGRLVKKWAMAKDVVLPLVEFGLTQKHCLALCAFYGCNWKGHYIKYDRFSCWCCPRQKIQDLRILFNEKPGMWHRLKKMDAIAPAGRKFRWGGKSLWQLELRFRRENAEKQNT